MAGSADKEYQAFLKRQSLYAEAGQYATQGLGIIADQAQYRYGQRVLERNISNLGQTIADAKRIANKQVARAELESQIDEASQLVGLGGGLGSSSRVDVMENVSLGLGETVTNIRDQETRQVRALEERQRQLEEQRRAQKKARTIGLVTSIASIAIGAATGGVGAALVGAAGSLFANKDKVSGSTGRAPSLDTTFDKPGVAGF